MQALARPGVEVFEYLHCQTFLPDQPCLALLVVTLCADQNRWLAAVSDAADTREFLLTNPGVDATLSWLKRRQVACLCPDAPWQLSPVSIAKPWGREVWFTGIEARGESAFVDNLGFTIPLSWLLTLMPKTLLGASLPALTLLKILDPLPEPVFGDLYFEMHEQKQEVYVVTHVDSRAWPGGRGGIRFGFDQALRRQYASDRAFRQAYLDVVSQYENIRRAIDAQIDDMRIRDGVGVNAAVEADQQKQWMARVSPELAAAEADARAQMDRFAHVLPLRVGDVVKVPCFTPHSLLHGVTTVEFQTPVYERKILSFAQKVLTQSHWDTAEALSKISLDAPVNPPLVLVSESDGVVREQVVQFDDFRVLRISLEAGASCQVESGYYRLVMVLSGVAQLDQQPVAEGQAFFVPAIKDSTLVLNQGDSPLVLLLSEPI